MKTGAMSFGLRMKGLALLLTLFTGACGLDPQGDAQNGAGAVAGQFEFTSAAPVAGVVLDAAVGESSSPDAARNDNAEGGDVRREIEEADIIRVEGGRLYLLNRYRGLFICDIASPDNPVLLGRLNVTGSPVDMYIRDDHAYIIVSAAHPYFYGFRGMTDAPPDGVSTVDMPDTGGSRVIVADVSDPSDPTILGSVAMEGRIADSRIVGRILYVVSARDDHDVGILPVDPIMDIAVADSRTADPTLGDTDHAARRAFVAAIDISDPRNATEVDREDLEGASPHIHVTDAAIFVPSTRGYYFQDQTTITYVDISDPAGAIRRRGHISLRGRIEDKFKMDYADGHFRVCSHEWSREGGVSNLYMIDVTDPDNMTVAGSVELGRGEQLFATRFDGDLAYMVTFEQIDPLYVIDLSDPRNPRIMGELEVPGWSTHIEPRGDRLIALGVDDEEGWRVSISLFDVADPRTPTLIQRVSFGDVNGWSSSSAYEDVKAFTIIDEMGLILLPYSTSSWNEGQYRHENRLQLVDYSDEGLTPRGWVVQRGSVLRSRTVDHRLFSVSERQIQVIDASDRDKPVITAAIGLVDNIVAFEPMSNGYGVRVVQDDMGASRLQAVPLSDPEYGDAAGEIALDRNESFNTLFVSGNRVYVISNYRGGGGSEDGPAWHDGYHRGVSRVTVYDFGHANAPSRRGRLDLEGSYTAVFRPDIHGILYPYHNPQGELHRLDHDILVFVQPSQRYDYPILYDGDIPSGVAAEPDDDAATRDDTENTVVRVIDLSAPDALVVASRTLLIHQHVSGCFASNGVLYFSYHNETEENLPGRPLVRFYLGRLDLDDINNPLELPAVNIPGVFLGLDAVGAYGYTLNMEYGESDDIREFSFNTVRLEGDRAYLQDTVSLGLSRHGWFYSHDYALAQERAYFIGFGSASGNETAVTVIDTSVPRNLNKRDHSFGGGGWQSLVAASGRRVFMRVSGGVACYDSADISALILEAYRNPAGWGDRIVFADGKAYVPMGYYGLWVMDMH